MSDDWGNRFFDSLAMTDHDRAKQLAPDLLPCPFCGSENLEVVGDDPTFQVGGFYVLCDNPPCQAQGRLSGQREKAVAAWNRRKQPAS